MTTKSFIPQKMANTRGFTLIELMIAVAIIGILASIALPAYNGSVSRSKIANGTGQLSDLRLRMEQFRQDNRTYLSSGACAATAASDDNFSFSCSATSNTFTWTATSTASLGDAGNYAYTINESGNQTTTAFNGTSYSSTPKTCWLYRGSEC